MGDQVDQANELVALQTQTKSSATHNFTLIYRVDDELVIDEQRCRLSECFDRLVEHHGLDLKHTPYAIGYKADDGSFVIKADPPEMRAELKAILAS